MTLSEHRCRFSFDLARLVMFGAPDGYDIAVGEVGRTRYQQAQYVRNGKSRTMNSDHLEARAVDLVLYKIQPDGSRRPVWAPEHYQHLADYWVSLDPRHNYWGYAEWGFDTPHFGRRKGKKSS